MSSRSERSSTAALRASLRLLATRRFGTFWFASLLSSMGTWAQQVARTASLYMLAMRGGISLGALLTGAAVNLLGVRRALLVDGALAIVAQLAIVYDEKSKPMP